VSKTVGYPARVGVEFKKGLVWRHLVPPGLVLCLVWRKSISFGKLTVKYKSTCRQRTHSGAIDTYYRHLTESVSVLKDRTIESQVGTPT
jgi:hypothetical protein